jgi:hypothetical protein
MSGSVDQHARDEAGDAMSRITTHEAVCAERYAGIQNSFRTGSEKMKELGEGQTMILRILAWGGALTLTTLVAATGWLTARLAEIALK